MNTTLHSTSKDVTLTNQALGYKDSYDIPRLAIPRLENVDKTPKFNLRINLGLSSDLGIAIPRFTRVDKNGH